ncbi:VOC family protein [Nonomuraea sp. NN258]|uniref:VOC family protein n=1 Tax=Nonomuraea antri TaxID=2730852 RepID=UPI001568EC9B|nr:VOC family protein [Nonomuraea antri]NRQ34642.1 VOC family protein [Nonomuraea antri]
MEWKIEVIPIPVTDVEKAKAFYGESLGFVVDHDTQVSPEMRIVQLTPPGSSCSIVLGASGTTPPGSLQGVQIVVDDIDAARAQLTGRGVEVSPVRHYAKDGTLAEGKGGRWNSFVFFNDLDGNGWVLQERPSGED